MSAAQLIPTHHADRGGYVVDRLGLAGSRNLYHIKWKLRVIRQVRSGSANRSRHKARGALREEDAPGAQLIEPGSFLHALTGRVFY